MYHYIRDQGGTRYPKINFLDRRGFDRQLDYLQDRFTVVRMEDVIAAVDGTGTLPDSAALLTFDDGYLEHYTTVFPVLHDRGIQGSFFPPVAPVADRTLLDVNRVHFILACAADPSALSLTVDSHVRDRAKDFDLGSVETYRKRWAHANRWDDADTIYVKRMLQTALPLELRRDIARALFSEHVAVDEAAFAAELYLTADQARLMVDGGMHFGSHGRNHVWLNHVDREEQEREVRGSLEFLGSIGMPVDDRWTMCYPFGGWSDSLLDVLRTLNCSVGLTTEVATADLSTHDRLTLPRYDTNDFPQ